jgi:hypothetical protein
MATKEVHEAVSRHKILRRRLHRDSQRRCDVSCWPLSVICIRYLSILKLKQPEA